MATTNSGQPTSSGIGTTDWGGATGDAAGARRAGGSNAGIAQMVRDTTYQRLDTQKERASETLGSLAGAVRSATQQLRDGGQPGIADYANRAADGIERWSSQLRQQDVQDAIRGVQRFARREPAMFLGLAFGTGLLVARFLKSSGDNSDFDPDSGASRWNTGASDLSRTTGGSVGSTMGTGSMGSTTGTGSMGVSSTTTSGTDALPRLGSDPRSTREGL